MTDMFVPKTKDCPCDCHREPSMQEDGGVISFTPVNGVEMRSAGTQGANLFCPRCECEGEATPGERALPNRAARRSAGMVDPRVEKVNTLISEAHAIAQKGDLPALNAHRQLVMAAARALDSADAMAQAGARLARLTRSAQAVSSIESARQRVRDRAKAAGLEPLI